MEKRRREPPAWLIADLRQQQVAARAIERVFYCPDPGFLVVCDLEVDGNKESREVAIDLN